MVTKEGIKPTIERKESREQLPILEHKKEILEELRAKDIILVIGETGSGKTTRIPGMLYEVIEENGGKVIVTQPRRLPARSVSRYVARQFNCKLGTEIGYQVRFDNRTSEETKISFVTDGILLNKIQEDPLLTDYSAVMVDEAHERSLNIDFTLGLLKNIQKKRKERKMKPLKIVVSSATLEREKFVDYFDVSSAIEVSGRLYPVTEHFEEESDPYCDYTMLAAEKVKFIIDQNKDGDILIFMPGKASINKTISEIESLNLDNVICLPLHGQLKPEEQDEIFKKRKERKIIISTNVAETSVTVPGIKHVIDSGKVKQIEYDPVNGIKSLVTKNNSKASCRQRKGRAGRVEEGEYWALFSESEFERREEFEKPEIQRSSLGEMILKMKKIGIDDIEFFDFIDRPQEEQLIEATEKLKRLGALDEEGRLTSKGELMAELPLEPFLSRIIIEAQENECVRSVVTLASFLGGRRVFVRPRGKEAEADEAHKRFKNLESDFLALLRVWEEYENNNFNKNWAYENYLNNKSLKEIRKIRDQLFRILRENNISAANGEQVENKREKIGKSIFSGLIDNLVMYYGRHSYRRLGKDDAGYYIHPSSCLFHQQPKFLVANKFFETTKKWCSTCQSVEPVWIVELAPHLVEQGRESFRYDSSSGRIIRTANCNIKGDSSLIRIEEELTGLKAKEALAVALYEERGIIRPFNKRNRELINKINSLWKRTSEDNQFMEEPLSERRTIIDFYKERMKDLSFEEARKKINNGELDLLIKEENFISKKQKEELLKNNPDKIEIGGREFGIEYYRSIYQEEPFAKIKTNLEGALCFLEEPKIPSGKKLYLEICDGAYRREYEQPFNLEKIRREAADQIIRNLWHYWKNYDSNKYNIVFNYSEEIPELPEPIQYGVDPITKEPLMVYFAYSFIDSNNARISFYRSLEEAEKIKKTFNKELKERRDAEEAKKRLIAVDDLVAKIRNDEILEEFFLSEQGREIIEDLNSMKWNEKLEKERLEEIEEKLKEVLERKDDIERCGKQIKKMIERHYSKCPICGGIIENERCDNNHDRSLIDYEINDMGNFVYNDIKLSELKTDQGEFVADLYCRPRGEVELVISDKFINGNLWNGKIFESLFYKNFNKILTPEKIKKKEREREMKKRKFRLRELEKRHKMILERAESSVEEGLFEKGFFEKGKHPKTGAEQWETTIHKNGKKIKYILHEDCPIVIEKGKEYFFSKNFTLVDKPNFELSIVWIEEPYPGEFEKQKEAILLGREPQIRRRRRRRRR